MKELPTCNIHKKTPPTQKSMALRARSPRRLRKIILMDNHVNPEIPPRVEYSLTMCVQSLRLMIN